MYRVRKGMQGDLKAYRTSWYSKTIGASPNFISAIINTKQKCTEITAKSILSACFGISFTDEKMQELLKKYFEEEESYGGSKETK